MTFDSEAAVREVLDEGYLFELTHDSDGEGRTHLVRHVEPHRPSMVPLHGPPTFWFETLGGGRKFSVRLPELVDLRAVPYDRIPDVLLEETLVTLAAVVEDDPERVPLAVIHSVLDDARQADGLATSGDALTLALTVLDGRDDAFDAIAAPTFAHLLRRESAEGETVLRRIVAHAKDQPASLEPHVPELVSLIDSESGHRRLATQCLMEVAEANPTATVDAVPALATVADATEGATRSYAVYALSQIARDYPEQVYPAVGTLVDAIGSDDDTTQTNASTALGRIAGEYPDAAEPIVDVIAELLDAEAKKVRNNAAGLLADIAQEYPAAVIEHADELAARFDDTNIQARINASIALQRAGEADPEAVRVQHARLEAALDDASPEVRANACLLVGNSEAPVPIERLRELRDDDPNETVRERAAWAVQRLS